jgi:hypothetical protein
MTGATARPRYSPRRSRSSSTAASTNATARALSVHHNTVTYRLSRVRELTGLDPHRPADAMPLEAARLARRLESAHFAP